VAVSNFELIEYAFDPDDFSLSMEDEFQIARLNTELDKATDPDQLREGAKKLLQLAVHRQAIIRSLVRRLADLETATIRTLYEE
jgi:hypothetical protein